MERTPGTNVKGVVGLILSLVSLCCIGISWVPLVPLTGMGFDGHLSFYGFLNMILLGVAFVCASAAVVFAAMSKKDADKRGPRKAGMIIGIIAIVITLLASLGIGTMSMITEYINSDGQSGVIAEATKTDENMKKQIDDAVAQLKNTLNGGNSHTESSNTVSTTVESSK